MTKINFKFTKIPRFHNLFSRRNLGMYLCYSLLKQHVKYINASQYYLLLGDKFHRIFFIRIFREIIIHMTEHNSTNKQTEPIIADNSTSAS